MRTLLSFLTILLLSFSAIAQDSLNVRRVGYCDTPGNTIWVEYSHGYAFVTDVFYGLRSINPENQTDPFLIGSLETPGSASSVFVYRNKAFVADGDSGVQIIDISNPSIPVLISQIRSIGHANNVVGNDSILLVAAGSRGVLIFDISDIANINQIGSCDTPYDANDVVVKNDYAYVADGASGFRILDITDRTNPFEVGYYVTPRSAYSLDVVGNLAYVCVSDSGLVVLDISNPTYPFFVSFFETQGDPKSVVIQNSFAIIADGQRGGIRVVNIKYPNTPIETGFYNTTGQCDNVVMSGVYAYVADGFSGLGIYDCSVAIRHISIASPTDEISLPIGSVNTICWTSAAINGNVNIELNRAYPSPNWEMLFANTPNDSSQPWTVTGPYTNSARIRITSVENPAIGDTSDANFTIGIVPATPGNLTVTLQGEDAQLAWARVDTSLSGYPITVQRYLIFYRDDGAEPWQYLWATFGANTTNFTHTSVVRFSPAMYYEVRAWFGDTDSFDRTIRDIPPGLREDVFLQRIGGNVSAPIVKQVE